MAPNSSNQYIYQSPNVGQLRYGVSAPTATVIVSQGGNGLDYWLMSKHQTIYGGNISSSAIPSREKFLSDFADMVGNSVQLTGLSESQLASLWFHLRSFGQHLYTTLLTEQLRNAATEWEAGSVINVGQNEDWFPWELVYDGDNFWGAKYIIARIPRVSGPGALVPRTKVDSSSDIYVRKIANIVGGGLGTTEISAKARDLFVAFWESLVINVHETPTVSDVVSALSDADIIHFTCHGHLKPLCLQVGSFAPGQPGADLSCLNILNIRALNQLSHALVFANACSSASTASFLGALHNFAWEFYLKGADAYIGTLGLVPTNYAVEFAKHFYDQLLQGLTVGEALLNARRHAQQTNNPFWLLYCLYGDPFTRKSWIIVDREESTK